MISSPVFAQSLFCTFKGDKGVEEKLELELSGKNIVIMLRNSIYKSDRCTSENTPNYYAINCSETKLGGIGLILNSENVKMGFIIIDSLNVFAEIKCN